MSQTVTDADRIAADGVPIPLVDGTTAELRFGMRAIRHLERQFGSLDAMQEALPGEDGPPDGAFEAMCAVLYAGLMHTGRSEDEVLDLLSPRMLNRYAEAIGQAFAIAFPEVESGNVEGEPSRPGLQANGSPGATSTGSSPSGSAVPTNSSGG